MCEWDSMLAPLTQRQREIALELQYSSVSIDDHAQQTDDDAPRSVRQQNIIEFCQWLNESDEPPSTGEAAAQDLLESGRAMVDSLLLAEQRVDDVLQHLQRVDAGYADVWQKIDSIHQVCEALSAERSELLDVADTLSARTEPFRSLELLTFKLHSSSIRAASNDFVQLLPRLHAGIAYLRHNPQFRDAPQFLAKYEALAEHTRRKVAAEFESAVEEAMTSSSNSNADSETTAKVGVIDEHDDELVFARFRASMRALAPLLQQIDRLGRSSTEEDAAGFRSLSLQLQQIFLSEREKRVSNRLREELVRLVTPHGRRDICQFVRLACALVLRRCSDEWRLFDAVFGADHSSLSIDAYLLRLGARLYDAVRPLIVHCAHVEQLSELCALLAAEAHSGFAVENPAECRAYSQIVGGQLLSDVQERLVYRVHVFVSEEIASYQAIGGDLAYPSKLEVMRDVIDDDASSPPPQTTQLLTGKRLSSSSMSNLSIISMTTTTCANQGGVAPADLPGVWFPTLRRTLALIRRLALSLDPTTMQGLACEAVSACVTSLQAASELIRSNANASDSFSAQLNARLFLVKHLLLLRDALAHYRVDLSITETTLDVHAGIRQLGSRRRSGNSPVSGSDDDQQSLYRALETLLRSASHEPLVEAHETRRDARSELDAALRSACLELIEQVIGGVAEPALAFLDKAEILERIATGESSAPTSRRRLAEHDFARPEELRDLILHFQLLLKKRIVPLGLLLDLYMTRESAARSVLCAPIHSRLIDCIVRLGQTLERHYSEAERALVALPTQRDLLGEALHALGGGTAPEAFIGEEDESVSVVRSSSATPRPSVSHEEIADDGVFVHAPDSTLSN